MQKRIILTVTAVLLAFSITACNKSGNKANSGSTKAGTSFKENPASDFKYTMTDDGTGVLITEYIGKSPKIVIPATIEGLPVLEVSELAKRDHEYGDRYWNNFLGEWVYHKNNITITHIIFPDCVRLLGYTGYGSLFRLDCSNYDALEYVKLPAGTSEGPNFSNCDKLKTVIIPEGVKIMPDLSKCKSLESITLPSTISQLSRFTESTNLKEIIIPENITSLSFNFDGG